MRGYKCYDYCKGGNLRAADMEYSQITRKLQTLGRQAKNVLRESGCDHVIYGMRSDDEFGGVRSFNFLLLPVKDDYYRRKVMTIKNVYVYAVHSDKSY